MIIESPVLVVWRPLHQSQKSASIINATTRHSVSYIPGNRRSTTTYHTASPGLYTCCLAGTLRQLDVHSAVDAEPFGYPIHDECENF